jgi:hypothetical protein
MALDRGRWVRFLCVLLILRIVLDVNIAGLNDRKLLCLVENERKSSTSFQS